MYETSLYGIVLGFAKKIMCLLVLLIDVSDIVSNRVLISCHLSILDRVLC